MTKSLQTPKPSIWRAFGASLLASLIFFPGTSSSMTLHQIYDSAVQQSENSQIIRLETDRAQELKTQAYGAMLPSLQLNYRVLAQDIPPTAPGGNVPSAFRQDQQTTSAISLVQPLFRGGSEYASLKMAKLASENATSLEQVFDRQLWEQIAQDFYSVISLEKEYQILQRLKNTLRDRVAELQRRARIGQTRRSDLLSARAQAQVTEAELLSIQAQLDSSRRALEVRTSLQLTDGLVDNVEVPTEIPDLSAYLEKLSSHPSLAVARTNVELADQNRRLESGSRWPQVDLQGNYYLERPGVLEDSKWDVSLNLTLPIFRGGIVNSRVRDAVYLRAQRELELSHLQREMNALLRDRHQDAVRVQASLKSLRDSVELYRQSYNLLNQEYRSGIISYLEVNPTEREYWESLRRLQHQEAEHKLAWIRLQSSVGDRP